MFCWKNKLSKEEKEGWLIEKRTNKWKKEGSNKDQMIFKWRRKRRNLMANKLTYPQKNLFPEEFIVRRTYSQKNSQLEEHIVRRRTEKTRTNASYNHSKKKKNNEKFYDNHSNKWRKGVGIYCNHHVIDLLHYKLHCLHFSTT